MAIDRSPTVDLIRHRLAPLQASRLDIADDSHRHAGHAGAKEGGHFILTISASCFNGLTPLQRHRMVIDLLGDLPSAGIHALSVVAINEPVPARTVADPL